MYDILFSFFAANQSLMLLAVVALTSIYLIYNLSQKYRVKIDFKKFIYDSPNLKINTGSSSSVSTTVSSSVSPTTIKSSASPTTINNIKK